MNAKFLSAYRQYKKWAKENNIVAKVRHKFKKAQWRKKAIRAENQNLNRSPRGLTHEPLSSEHDPAVLKANIKIKNPWILTGINPKPTISLRQCLPRDPPGGGGGGGPSTKLKIILNTSSKTV